MAKDVRLIRSFGAEVGVDLRGATQVAGVLADAQAAGYGAENASALIKVIAADAGVSLAR